MTTAMVDLRRIAGESALEYVQSGMVLGIGTGRTVDHFIDGLGAKYRTGDLRDIQAVPTSMNSELKLRRYGIPLANLVDHPILDMAVDGADEVDPQLNLIKGLGRALMREKVVEIHTCHLVIIVDESKVVWRLGSTCPLPVEILPFEALSHVRWLQELCDRAELWREEDGSAVVTDNGNYLARCWFESGIVNPYELNDQLNRRPGILEHGLFLDMARRVLIAGADGIKQLERTDVG